PRHATRRLLARAPASRHPRHHARDQTPSAQSPRHPPDCPHQPAPRPPPPFSSPRPPPNPPPPGSPPAAPAALPPPLPPHLPPPPPLCPPPSPQPPQRCPVGCPGRVISRVRGCRPDGAQPRTAHQRNKPGHTAVRAASVRTEATLTHDVRRRPTLPRGPPRSTIGAEELNFRVRNGTGCFPFAMTAETLWRFRSSAFPEAWPPRDAADRTSGTAQWTRPFRGSGGRPPGQHSTWELPPRRDV